MAVVDETKKRRLELEDDDSSSCCASCDFVATPPSVRIVTWASVAPTLQAYVDFYQLANPKAGQIRLTVLPSLQELNAEAVFDLQAKTGLYDGFVVPPMMIGGLYEQEGLAEFNLTTESPKWRDILPYYRNLVATYDGAVRSVPLFAGNQLLLLFRKDYFESSGAVPPKTWGDMIRVAASLHNQPLGKDGETVYGLCLGRVSDAACRERMDISGGTCNSLSMTYLGMSLAGMTQLDGSSTGWLFDDDTSQGMSPLLKPTLERFLYFTEQLLKYGAPDELQADASLNMDLFQQGRCAMTISADHPADLLQSPDVGFAPVPSTFQVLDREKEEMVECTRELCPHSEFYQDWGQVNQAPIGAHDMVVGGVSTVASEPNQATVKDFLEFVMTTELKNISVREQPLTYTGLQSSTIEGYEELMETLTSHENAAIPFRVPGSYRLLSIMDTEVYDYFVAGNYTAPNRERVRQSVEQQWNRQIKRNDDRFQALPTSVFYEKSLGIFTAESASDLYIGWPFRSAGWALGGLSCFTSVFFALWVWKHQHERVVRASQPIFLWMLCAGTFVMALCIFLFGIEDDIASERAANASCMSAIWLYSFGYTTTFAALFSKMWQINRIFLHSRNIQHIKVESQDVLLPFFLLFGVNFVVLLVWTITDSVEWVREEINNPGATLNLVETSTFGICDSDNYRLYLGLIVGTNLIVSLIALIQAYECRKISTEYSESLWISGALACIVQVWLVGLPVLKWLGDNPKATFFVKVGIVFVTCMSTLLLLFVPKMRYLRESLSERMEEQKGVVRAPIYDSGDSNTVQDHSHGTDDSFGGKFHANVPSMKIGTSRISGLEPPSTSRAQLTKSIQSSGILGIRIIQSSSRHSEEEVERLQKNMNQAEKRNKVLQDRLERLQEKLEQYMVANHSHGGENILGARPEQIRLSGASGTDSSQQS